MLFLNSLEGMHVTAEEAPEAAVELCIEVDRPLLDARGDAGELAIEIHQIPGVKSAVVLARAVTVRRNPVIPWERILPLVAKALREFHDRASAAVDDAPAQPGE
jgi:hypothetical protein